MADPTTIVLYDELHHAPNEPGQRRPDYRFSACDICWHETLLTRVGHRLLCAPCHEEWAR
jgi:hypothetical protein